MATTYNRGMKLAISTLHNMNSEDLRKSDGGRCCLLADVLDYLVRHPGAQDTVEGIAEWWVLEQQAARVVTGVEAALSDLVAKDFLVARASGGRTYYRLNRDKEREICRFLRKQPLVVKSKNSAKSADCCLRA